MNITDYLQAIIPLSPATSEAVTLAFRPLHYSKNQSLHEHGKTARYLYYIEKGLARIYYYNDQGKDITYGFYTETDMITVAESFFEQKPARYSIELLEDSLIYALSFHNLNQLLEQYPELEKVKSYSLLYFLQKATDRIVALQFQSAQQRYDTLMEVQPSIIQRAPLGHIASYLGITQETLSRIRSKR